MKCKVCGKEFMPIIDRHYLTRDNEVVRTGLVSLGGAADKEVAIYDTFDCPECGCQHVIQERKRQYYSNVIEAKNLSKKESEELSEEEPEDERGNKEDEKPVDDDDEEVRYF